MTLTTTTVNGCDAGIWADNASGTPKDIGGSSNAFTLEISQNVGEQRVFGSRWPTRKVCGKDATLTLTVLYSTATDEGLDIMRDWMMATDPTPRTVKLYLPNKNVGSDVYSGEWVLETLSIPVTAGEGAPIAVECSLMISGELTYSQAAT